jgi:hypothetical protein
MHSLYTGLYQQWLADGNSCDDAVSSGDVLGDLCPSSVSV